MEKTALESNDNISKKTPQTNKPQKSQLMNFFLIILEFN